MQGAPGPASARAETPFQQQVVARVSAGSQQEPVAWVEILNYTGSILLTNGLVCAYIVLIGRAIVFLGLDLAFQPLPEGSWVLATPGPQAGTEGPLLQMPTISSGSYQEAFSLLLTLKFNKYGQTLAGRVLPTGRQWKDTGRQLGKGSYGVVTTASSEGQEYAKKTILARNSAGQLVASYVREVSLNMMLSSPFLTTLVDLREQGQEVQIYLPLAEMDLYRAIRKKSIQENEFVLLAYQLLQGLGALRNAGARHRDIKSQNVLLYPLSRPIVLKIGDVEYLARWRATLADFGIGTANECGALPGQYDFDVYTSWYRPPEILLSSEANYSEAAEVWALGATLAELWVGRSIFQGDTVQDLIRLQFQALGTPRIEEWPEARDMPLFPKEPEAPPGEFARAPRTPFQQLVFRMLTFNPKFRPAPAQLLQDPVFRGLSPAFEEALIGVRPQQLEVRAVIPGNTPVPVSTNPMDYLVPSHLADLTCRQRIICRQTRPIPYVQIGERDFSTVSNNLFLLADPYSTRAYFLAHYYLGLVVEAFPLQSQQPAERWTAAALALSILINDTNKYFKSKRNLGDDESKIFALCRQQAFWATSYDLLQASRTLYPPVVYDLALALLLYFSQYLFSLALPIEDMTAFCINLGSRIAQIQVGLGPLTQFELAAVRILQQSPASPLTEVFKESTNLTPAQAAELILRQPQAPPPLTPPTLQPLVLSPSRPGPRATSGVFYVAP